MMFPISLYTVSYLMCGMGFYNMTNHRGTVPTVLVALMAGIMITSGSLAYGGAGYDYDGRDGMDYDYKGHDGMDYHYEDHKYTMYPMPDASGKYAPPLQQLQSGVPIQNVQCNDPLVLYIRDSPSPDDLMMMADTVTVMMEDIVAVMTENMVTMMMEDMDTMKKDKGAMMGEMVNDHMMMKEDMDAMAKGKGAMMDEVMNDPVMSEIVEKMESSAVLCIRDSTAETMMSRGIDLTSFDVLEPTVSALMDAMETSFMDAMEASFMDTIDKILRGLIHDAIETYDMNEGNLDVLTKTGTDELYVFVIDSDYVVVAHGADPSLVGTITAHDVDPTPSVEEIAQILAEEGEAWVSYMFMNPATGEDELKKVLLIPHDGYIFVSGYYMPDHHMTDHSDKMKPYSKDIDKTLRGLIHDAIETYDMNEGNLDVLTKTGTDELYVFVIDSDYVVVAHGADPSLVGTITAHDVDPTPSVEEIAQILAEEGEAWVSYMFMNPATGEDELKKVLLIPHDGYIFASGYYMSED